MKSIWQQNVIKRVKQAPAGRVGIVMGNPAIDFSPTGEIIHDTQINAFIQGRNFNQEISDTQHAISMCLPIDMHKETSQKVNQLFQEGISNRKIINRQSATVAEMADEVQTPYHKVFSQELEKLKDIYVFTETKLRHAYSHKLKNLTEDKKAIGDDFQLFERAITTEGSNKQMHCAGVYASVYAQLYKKMLAGSEPSANDWIIGFWSKDHSRTDRETALWGKLIAKYLLGVRAQIENIFVDHIEGSEKISRLGTCSGNYCATR